MIKKLNIKILILLLSIIIISGYLLISSIIGNDRFKNLKSLLDREQRELIKKYIFPYKKISELEQRINMTFTHLELVDKKNGIQIETYKKSTKLLNGKTLDRYKLLSNFYAGISKSFPGTGYIDFYEGNIVVISSRGVLAFKKNVEDNKENFQQIKNNINEFIGVNQFKKGNSFTLKDIHISNNKVYFLHRRNQSRLLEYIYHLWRYKL